MKDRHVWPVSPLRHKMTKLTKSFKSDGHAKTINNDEKSIKTYMYKYIE